MSKNSSNGKSRNEKFVKKIAVSDKFKTMMDKALPAARAVLEQRKKDLDIWEGSEQQEFYDIFGVKGEEQFVHKFKICTDLATGSIASNNGQEKTTVLKFMRQSVDRMIVIMDKLQVENRKLRIPREYEEVEVRKVYIYGNFVNRTYTSQFSAFVKKTDTCYRKPSQYGDYLEVNIGHNFENKELTGVDSMASTLCHEISHFERVEYKPNIEGEDDGTISETESDKELNKQKYIGSWGGVGTSDLPEDGKEHKGGGDSTYIDTRNEFRNNHSFKVFENSYNFECYFEIKI